MKILLVVMLCVLAVPVTQLRTVSTVITCCCPDPSHCHCPDHKPDHSGQPAMRACHRQVHEFVSPVLPAFEGPPVIAVARPEQAIEIVAAPLRSPHAAPTLRRPDAPS